MSTPVASVRHLIVVVLLVAEDCSLIHDFLEKDGNVPYHGWPTLFRLGFFGSVLMANLVVLGGSMLIPRRDGGQPFLTGFVLAGIASILTIQGGAFLMPEAWFDPMIRHCYAGLRSIDRSYGHKMNPRDFMKVAPFLCFGGLFFIAEFSTAMAVGLVAWRAHRASRRMARGLPGKSIGDD